MKRYIVTGAPGSGKTSVLQMLEFQGFKVVHEAVTEIMRNNQKNGMDAPWQESFFLQQILDLQKTRLAKDEKSVHGVEFHDRSVLDTYILGIYLQQDCPKMLEAEIRSILQTGIYETRVFFFESLESYQTTPERRMSREEAHLFGLLHEKVFLEFQFQLIKVPPMQVSQRVEFIKNCVSEFESYLVRM